MHILGFFDNQPGFPFSTLLKSWVGWKLFVGLSRRPLLNVVVDMWIHSDAVCEWLGCWEQKREAKEEYIVKVPGTFEHVSSPGTRA